MSPPSPDSESATFLRDFILSTPISKSSLSHFSNHPLLSNSIYEPIPTYSRVLKSRTGEDHFFSRTVNTPTTIPHQLTFTLRSPRPLPSSSKLWKPSRNADSSRGQGIETAPENPDLLILMHLASPGMDGHPNTMHGGMLCAILDEMMGLCVMMAVDAQAVAENEERRSIYTVKLDTAYRRPVETPQDVVVRTWIEGRDGRKVWCVGQVLNRRGEVCTQAKGLWVIVKGKGAVL